MGPGRSVRRAGDVMVGAVARDRLGRFAFPLPQAWRLPAGTRGYAGISPGRAEDPGLRRRLASPQDSSRVAAGPESAVASEGGISDRAAAPDGAAAPWSKLGGIA